jgi:LPS-assembly protein
MHAWWLLLICFLTAVVAAQEGCPRYPLGEALVFSQVPAADFASEDNTLRLRADSLQAEDDLWTWQGQVRADYGDYRLYSEEIQLNPDRQTLLLTLPFFLENPDYRARGAAGTWDFQQQQGTIDQAEVRLRLRPGRLGGMEIKSFEQRLEITKGFYTTCSDRSWLLTAEALKADFDQGFATAKNIRFTFKDVPLFYWPSWRFPIDDRRLSGFLYPSLSNAQSTGLTIKIPYYWNIAENRDATLSFNLFSRRGLQVASEFRHLDALGSNRKYRLEGQLNLALLNDRLINGDNRRFWAITEQLRPAEAPRWQLGRNNPGFWQLDLAFQEASDKNYLSDLESGFDLVNQPYLAKNFLLRRQNDFWQWSLRSNIFQALDRQREFFLAPQLQLERQRPWVLLAGFFLSGQVEISHFQDPGQRLGVAGWRQVVEAQLQRPFEWAGFWWQPEVHFQWRHYDLEQEKDLTYQKISGKVQLSRLLLSTPSRLLNLQLAYFYQPKVSETKVNFDSSLRSFDYYRLFNANSFSGYDQHSQGQRLVIGLENSQGSGERRLEWRLAQSLPWDNQGAADKDFLYKNSLFFAEIRGQQQNLSWQAEWAVDNARFRLAQNRLRLHWQPEDTRKRLQVNYRYQRDDAAQADIGGHWPLVGRWQVQAYVSYAFEEKRLLEGQLGLIYDTCCWAFRLGNTAFYVANRDRYENILGIQLTFKGLASIGSRDSSLYPKEIYDDFFLPITTKFSP